MSIKSIKIRVLKYDLTGKRFGRLLVVKRSDEGEKNDVKWECLCDCGTKKNVRSYYLRKGLQISCGCSKKRAAVYKCSKCGADRNKENFHKDSSRKDGLSYKCKVCTRKAFTIQ